MEDQGEEGPVLSGLDHDTSFLLKDSACSARTSSDSGASCTNSDEIFK